MAASADSVRVIHPERGQGEIVSVGSKKLVLVQWGNGTRSLIDKPNACAMVENKP